MPLTVTIKDVPPFDGTYPFEDGRDFTNHELHVIKKVAGVRLGELDEARRALDTDLMICLAAIAVERAGKVDKASIYDLLELFMDAPTSALVWKLEEDEPAVPLPAPASEPESSGDDGASSPSSSGSSPSPTEPSPASFPLATGDPGSDATSHSDLAISTT
jgi:hypothetical protein